MKRHLNAKNAILGNLCKKDGATIVFALVVFMVAAIVSVTIVNIALSNLSRTFDRGAHEQARLAVSSAAKYLESNETDLNLALSAMTAPGDTWTVNVSDSAANDALETTIKWTDVSNMSAMTARLSSGDYTAEVRIVYDAATSKWSISRFKKK
jgi:hypothetical protein